jgi:FMN phosphatase YigB (HAD superfamily)
MTPAITHIFFDLHGTLVDGVALHPCYSAAYGDLMAARYGKSAEVWTQANWRIVADWDSYYADLDLGGENGMADMWEGYFRVTRAMFRLAGVPEPSRNEIAALSREVPTIVPRHCDALYSDVRPAIATLHAAGYILGVTSHALTGQARATLQGGGILDTFAGSIIGPDVAEQFVKDEAFFRCAIRAAGAAASHCLVVDDHADAIRGAHDAGTRTAQVIRSGSKRRQTQTADLILTGGLQDLPDLLRNLT